MTQDPLLPAPNARPGSGFRWWRSPWIAVLVAIVAVNLIYALPRYLQMDPSQARVEIDPGFAPHFPMIIVHLLTGNLALVAAALQVMPWIRRRYPALHRMSGRIYVFGGVLPSVALGLILIPQLPVNSGQVGLVTEATLWVATTVAGFRMARQRRFAEHRRWMTYSFALAVGTTWTRVLYFAMVSIPGFAIREDIFHELASWLGWIVNLLVAQWWLERTGRKARRELAGTTSA